MKGVIAKMTIVSAVWCSNCVAVKNKLDSLGVDYAVVDADTDFGSEWCMEKGVRSLPTMVVSYEDIMLEDVIIGQANILKYVQENKE